jgi:general secretion pathway protein G
MLVTPVRNSARRRGAFTLLEVLVVVAILVVLASVASIAVFRYLGEARKDKALLDMQALTKAFDSYMLKNDEVAPQSIQDLAPYMTEGSNALIDPWGNPYQFRQMADAEQPNRVQFFTVAPDGQEIVWPRR